jgi:dihydrolipoamide dehydrogenase
VDWTRIRARKDALVSSIVGNLERSLKENPRIELVRGSARFLGPKRVEVGGRAVEAERIIVASGVVPVVPDIPGLREAGLDIRTAARPERVERAANGTPAVVAQIKGGPSASSARRSWSPQGAGRTSCRRWILARPASRATASAASRPT